MAINKVDWPTASTPSYTPSISTDYNAQNENLERVIRGYNAVSLTNWDSTTTAPEVAAGSVIEANGVLYDITTDTAISTSSASSGTIYLAFEDDTTYGFYWSSSAPTWSDTLNGWYIGDDRSTGHYCTWDGSSSFTFKASFAANLASGDSLGLSSSGGGYYGSSAISASGTVLIPRGAYIWAQSQAVGPSVGVEFKDNSGSWLVVGTDIRGATSGFVISDGVNFRWHEVSGTAATIYYRKIW